MFTHFFSYTWKLCTDFLFPKNKRVLELEALPTDTFLNVLPSAEHIKDKNIIALFDYNHPVVKEIIWEIKYKGNRQLISKLAGILYDIICHELSERNLFDKWDKPILMPIPISDKRRFERGWNQSELLAEAIKSIDNGRNLKYLPRQLVKFRHTESQTKTSSKNERLENLKNSMKVLNTSLVNGECVVVLDDVTTTGSTFAEAKRALCASGAKKVLCVAIAH